MNAVVSHVESSYAWVAKRFRSSMKISNSATKPGDFCCQLCVPCLGKGHHADGQTKAGRYEFSAMKRVPLSCFKKHGGPDVKKDAYHEALQSRHENLDLVRNYGE